MGSVCYNHVGLITVWFCHVAWIEVVTVLPPYTDLHCAAVPPQCDVDVPVFGGSSDSNETGILLYRYE
jgi:hypothetical protein